MCMWKHINKICIFVCHLNSPTLCVKFTCARHAHLHTQWGNHQLQSVLLLHHQLQSVPLSLQCILPTIWVWLNRVWYIHDLHATAWCNLDLSAWDLQSGIPTMVPRSKSRWSFSHTYVTTCRFKRTLLKQNDFKRSQNDTNTTQLAMMRSSLPVAQVCSHHFVYQALAQ